MRDVFQTVLKQELQADHNLALILGDIGSYAFRGEIERYPERVINVGILEQAMVGFAAGLAVREYYPVIHSIAPFLIERTFEQIKLDFGYQGLSGTFVSVGAPYDYARLGGTHHSPSDFALMSSIPGMEVWSPASADQAEQVIRDSIRNRSLSYVRLSSSLSDAKLGERDEPVTHLRDGPGPYILSIGSSLDQVEKAIGANQVNLVHVARVHPFPIWELARVVEPGCDLLIIEPAFEGSTLYSEADIASLFRVKCLGIPREFASEFGSIEELDNLFGLSPFQIKTWLQQNGVPLEGDIAESGLLTSTKSMGQVRKKR